MGTRMAKFTLDFWKDEPGQDLTEHALLLAMISLVAAALFLDSGASVSGVWNSADSKISTAYRSASS